MRTKCIKCGTPLHSKNAQDMGICLRCYNIEQSDFEEEEPECEKPITADRVEKECDQCDGCGWYEGGPTIKTTCKHCNGTGKILISPSIEMHLKKVKETIERTGYEKAQEIVRQIPVNTANFEHIAKSGKINGSLMADLCELLIKYKVVVTETAKTEDRVEKQPKDEYKYIPYVNDLNQEIRELRRENERLQKESKWNREQCVNLQAELSEARKAGRNEAIDAIVKEIESWKYRVEHAPVDHEVIKYISSLKL